MDRSVVQPSWWWNLTYRSRRLPAVLAHIAQELPHESRWRERTYADEKIAILVYDYNQGCIAHPVYGPGHMIVTVKNVGVVYEWDDGYCDGYKVRINHPGQWMIYVRSLCWQADQAQCARISAERQASIAEEKQKKADEFREKFAPINDADVFGVML